MQQLYTVRRKLLWFAVVCISVGLLASAAGGAGRGLAAPGPALPDVAGHWAESEVRAMAALQVVSGFPDGTYRPEETVTREQFLKLLVETAGWPVAGQAEGRQTFPDVPPGHWSHPYIEAAVAHGVIDPGGQFAPQRPVTRLEVARWLHRADPEMPRVPGGAPGSSSSFADVSRIPAEALPAVEAVAAAGLIRGFPDGRFGPDEPLTRAQGATILWRYLCLPRPLQVGGIYAIRSYEQKDFLPRLDWAAFGWATLSQGEGDTRPRIRLDEQSSVYRLPPGWEEVSSHSTGLLMVFCDRAQVLTALLSNPAWWPEVAAEAAAAVDRLGMKGVLIDFEYLRDKNDWGGPGLAAAYVKFLGVVRDHLPPGHLLMVAVPPANVPSHFDGYDYAAISRVADRLLLMAHDYQEADAPSPLAPLPAVAEGVRAVVGAGVDPSRIILGMSLTARQWVVDEKGQVKRAYYPVLDTVYQSVREHTASGQGTASFDVQAQAPVFTYVQSSGQGGNGSERNVVWYEDLRSVTAKIALARRYRLGGVSLWRLGIIPDQLLGEVLATCGHAP